ncbi:M1 family metallopeptidase [Nocardiopsis sp. RSe5-2]|uniref:Aminopeptidase N n=1 Tax=Nocardiopsis endophytica TaxID=3018445 RepID=A0ABT4UD87_9ACTN|nr:M1 family metallopeptidase [Nocardiopsis endophytica]MDA2814952.1 M1 family metallopeptidase [Nocardiopsis endophytica]
MRVRRGAAMAAAFLTALVPATAAAADPGGGIGDPYFPSYGNSGYDVDHYDLRLDYKPDTDRLKGTATLVARTTEELDSFTLDFLLDVDSVRVNGRPAEFSSEGHKLTVTPKKAVAEDRQMTVVVKYADTPSTVGWGDVPTAWHRGEDGVVALGEPEASWWWFPANDHPRDKATFDVRIQVPEGYKAVSNGVLTGQQTRGGKDIYLWRQDRPAATYLATLAVGDYEVHEDETASGLPVYNAYSPALGDLAGPARASIERGAEILEFQEESFGPYPYNALGGVVAGPDTDLGFALETQTRPVYSHAFFARGSNTYVVAHELAHQWWGDHVSVDTWQDIWLNEGFASYAEWMWSENEGEGTAQELAEYTYAQYPADSDFWTVPPGDPGAGNVFHSAVYDRGALAVHALRVEVGDEDFDAILRTWQEDRAHGNGNVGEFIALSEKISGEDLDDLFDTWLYTPERPAAAPGAEGDGPTTLSAPAEPKSWDTIQRNRELFHDGQHGGHEH